MQTKALLLQDYGLHFNVRLNNRQRNDDIKNIRELSGITSCAQLYVNLIGLHILGIK